MHKVDIAIIGGGIIGLTLAAALNGSGLNIAIVADSPFSQALSDEPELRVSALSLDNIEHLQALNIWQHMPQVRVCHYTDMQVWDQDSFGRIGFHAEEMALSHLGCIVENQALVNSLYQQLASRHDIVWFPQQRVSKLLQGEQETMLMLENDEVISTKLVVGADGANSYIRRQANFPMTFKDYDHSAIVATVNTQKPHQQVARQAFTPTGPLALLPLPNPHQCSIVWSQDTDVASELLTLNTEDFGNALTVASNGELGQLTLASQTASFPLTMRYARQWVSDGLVIIGDAAHTIHPLAGQGANLGMQDAFALAQALTDLHVQGKAINLRDNLRAFERARKGEAVKMIAAMEGFKQLFAGNHPIKKLIRGVGLTLTDQLPLVKRQFVSKALGL